MRRLRRIGVSDFDGADRICIAVAIKLELPVLTTDCAWAKLKIPGLTVELVR